jgi:hypothetical protein
MAENVLPPVNPLQMYPICVVAPQPTYDELRVAAYKWDRIAKDSAINYAFVGPFAAVLLRNVDYDIQCLSVLVDPATMENRLAGIWSTYGDHLRIQGNQPMIIVTGNIGVWVKFYSPGQPGYPSTLVLPTYSPQTGLHSDPHNNFLLKYLGCQPLQVPVIRARLLLERRILCFNFNATGEDQEKIARQHCVEINALLECSAMDLDPPFPHDVAMRLLPEIRRWIAYARRRYVPTTQERAREWIRLGFPLTMADVSANYRSQ